MSANHTLVLACGNSLRGDDGVGPAAAEIVKSWNAPGVKVLSVHQLVPELIAELGNVQRVLFVDAATNLDERPFEHRRIEPTKSGRALGHHESPGNLLGLLLDLEGHAPQAWLLSISACAFDHGETISERTRNHLESALVWIRAFLANGPRFPAP